MSINSARLNRIAQRLDKLAPAEPVIIRFVWHDEATGEEEPFGELTVDGRAPRVIELRWPEDEDDEKRTRQDAPGRA